MLGDQFLQTSPLGEPQERRKTRARHEIGIIEHRGDAMADSHPADALLCVEFVTVASHILFAQQGIRASRPAVHLKQTGGSGLSPDPPFRLG